MDIEKLVVVAAYLSGWRLDQRDLNRLRLINGKLSISIRPGSGAERGRWLMNGNAPLWVDRRPTGFHYMLNGVDEPRISVNASRAARSIANDIEKRLIPNYVKLYDQALTVIDAQKKKLSWCDQITTLIQRVVGAQYYCNGRRQMQYETQRKVSWGSYQSPSGNGEAVINSYNGGSIDLRISGLAPDKAIKLLALYKKEIVDDTECSNT